MNQISQHRQIVKKALSLKIRYQDLSDEYRKLQEIINQARKRRIKITLEKDKCFAELAKQLELLEDI